MTDKSADSHELTFALEGMRHPQSVVVKPDATAAEVLAAIIEKTGRADITEILIENQDACLPDDHHLVAVIIKEFVLVHAATKGLVKVTVGYNARHVDEEFRPNATMEKIIRWAISPKALDLEGTPADYQLKSGNEVLAGDTHLGQVSHGHKHVTLTLVFRVKPQG